MSRRYGYYQCNCGRYWRSAYTWCYHNTNQPEYGQDCQRCHNEVFAYRVEQLLVPNKNEIRNDDLSKNHNQALCHKCRHKSHPCSSNMNFTSNTYISDIDSNNESDQYNDEDDDLRLAIQNSLLNTNINKNINKHINTNIFDNEDDDLNNEFDVQNSNQNGNDFILDLCSSDNDNDKDDDNHDDNTYKHTQYTQYTQPQSAIDLTTNNNNNKYECTQYTQYTEAQSAFDLVTNNMEYTQCQSQNTQSPYICNRNNNNNRKRSRNEMEFNDETQTELYSLNLSPVMKRQKISHNTNNINTNMSVQSVAVKYGWNRIVSANMISFKKGKQRLNVWVKKGKNYGKYSMRIQPMEYSKTNISLKTFEESLSEINERRFNKSQKVEVNTYGMTPQEIRDMIERKRQAALERRKKRLLESQNSQKIETDKRIILTDEQRNLIEAKRQAALKRLKKWREQQNQEQWT